MGNSTHTWGERATLPLVSIVTPAYNQGQFIQDTMNSVRNQDYPHMEHIIVDDGSTDDTLARIREYEGSYNMRWSTGPNRGQSAALNSALANAKGQIIGWLNSDDIFVPRDAVSAVAQVFQKHPEVDVVYGDVIEIDEHNDVRRLRTNFRQPTAKLLLAFNFISQPATLFRARVLGPDLLDASLQCCMDYDLWLRLIDTTAFLHIDRFIAGVRYHAAAKNLARRDEMRREAEAVRRRYMGTREPHSIRMRLATLMFHCKRVAAIHRIRNLEQDTWTIPLKLDSMASLAIRQVPWLYNVVGRKRAT